MNKIKIIYDVARKMKDNDSIKGTLKAEGLKDQVKVFGMNKAFEKNHQDGQTKGKTSVEFECEGKKMKLENNIDFQGEGCHRHHGFINHMHSFHGHHHGAHGWGLKEGMNRITAVLGILSSIKLEEKEDKSVILSLESTDIPEDIRKEIHEKMRQGGEHHKHMDWSHQHPAFMQEFHTMENVDFTLNVYINKDSEIEKATIEANGERKDEKNERHDMKLVAELCFEW